jgi:hypothetical protein
MQRALSRSPFNILKWLACLLILKVTVSVVLIYDGYLPPDFTTDFLLGRQDYFWGSYSWAFYTHLAAGPPTLIVGMILLSNRFRACFPQWHRYLGRIQVANILLLLTPSGLWMAFYAMTGAVAGAAFVTLSLATAATAAMGWRTAVKRKFQSHQKWMLRNYVLLCSAVVIRMIGGLATVAQSEAIWLYPLAAWTSWSVPLLILELSPKIRQYARKSTGQLQPADVTRG